MSLIQYLSSFPSAPVFQNYSRYSLDARRRMLAYSLYTALGLPKTPTAVQGDAAFMQGWNEELQLNTLLYYTSTGAGLGTNASVVAATVDAAWGGPRGVVDADTVTNALWWAWLNRQGLSVPVNVIPTPPA